jgi:competence protein ComEA
VPAEARPWVIGLAVFALVGTVVVAVVVSSNVRSDTSALPNGVSPSAPLPDLPYAGTTAPVAAEAPRTTVVVHAAGAVARPGVYRLDGGARVADLIAAAGGVTGDADSDRLNLAAALVDGGRLYVPRQGELDVPPVDPNTTAGGDGPRSGSAIGSSGATDTTIDLNRADASQLEELPGVGPSIAAAIVDHRERNGPFRSIDDLLSVRGIGPTRLEDLRPLVRV